MLTKEEGQYIIKALAKILLAFALLSYVAVNEYRHREIVRVNQVGDQLFEKLIEMDTLLANDVKVLKRIHIYEFEKANEQARPTLP